ncbi:MAG TPA: nucleotidyltransferase family protein [Paracoccus sp. (in: a-proteobacteria)]|nr:nucleotidyltransferase family protein [Paracoccus sp. (in: a-proteobacteria)]
MRDDAAHALMLFAAGRGTRMAPLTDRIPKPLIKVGGRTLLDRALDLARAGGAQRIVVNIHHLGGQIADHLAGTDVALSDESDLLLDTGGGLRKALPLLGTGAARGAAPVLTLNPDAVWTGPNPVAALRAAWDGARMDALLMLVPLGRAAGRLGGGDFALDADGRLTRTGPLVHTGAQIIRPDRLAGIADEVFSLNRLWDLLIAEGRVFGIVHPGGWCDVGRPDCIPLAEAMLKEGPGR